MIRTLKSALLPLALAAALPAAASDAARLRGWTRHTFEVVELVRSKS